MRKRTGSALVGVASLSLVACASAQVTQTVGITNDDFIDNSAPTSNYGADAKVKAVSSPEPNMYSTANTSFTHVLFQIPAIVFTEFKSGLVTDVTVNYYPYNDSLPAPGAKNQANIGDGDGVMQLYAMTQSWDVGNGVQSPTPVASTIPGATWDTYDGTHAWANPNGGGDYDSSLDVVDNNTSLPAGLNNSPTGTTPFTWDITPLLQDASTFTELEDNGALIKMPDDPDLSAQELSSQQQDFVSFQSADNTSFTPYLQLTLVPEPASVLTVAALGGILCNRRGRRCRTVEAS